MVLRDDRIAVEYPGKLRLGDISWRCHCPLVPTVTHEVARPDLAAFPVRSSVTALFPFGSLQSESVFLFRGSPRVVTMKIRFNGELL